MFVIGSSRGFGVAFLSVAAGLGALFGAGALGLSSKAVAIGFLAMGIVGWLLGKHEPERGRACTLFFIPLRLGAAVALAAGALFLFVPGKSASSVPTKLDGIKSRLSNETASGSGPAAAEKAASYQRAILALEKVSGAEGKVSVHLDLDSDDVKAVRKASLFVQSANLRKYSDEGKRALISVCLKMLRADFPGAACNAAARGPILWGARGSSAGTDAAPVILLGSDDPGF